MEEVQNLLACYHYSVSISGSVHMLNGPLYSFTVNRIALHSTHCFMCIRTAVT